MFRNSVIHKIFSELLQPFWCVGMAQVSPFFIGVFVFIWFWIFGWLGQRVSPFSFHSTCSHDTDTGWDSIPHRSSFALVSLPLDTVVVGEVDELEEDVG